MNLWVPSFDKIARYLMRASLQIQRFLWCCDNIIALPTSPKLRVKHFLQKLHTLVEIKSPNRSDYLLLLLQCQCNPLLGSSDTCISQMEKPVWEHLNKLLFLTHLLSGAALERFLSCCLSLRRSCLISSLSLASPSSVQTHLRLFIKYSHLLSELIKLQVITVTELYSFRKKWRAFNSKLH